MKPLIRFCSETGTTLSPKWERIPGLSQRIGSYIGRRAVFNFHDRKRERRQRQQMIARRAARAAKAGEGG